MSTSYGSSSRSSGTYGRPIIVDTARDGASYRSSSSSSRFGSVSSPASSSRSTDYSSSGRSSASSVREQKYRDPFSSTGYTNTTVRNTTSGKTVVVVNGHYASRPSQNEPHPTYGNTYKDRR